MESSRTSLVSRTSSRTHFKVFGLGLEASSPRKLACPRLEDSTIFWIVKILWSGWKIFWKTFFCGDRLKNFCEDLFFFWRSPKKILWRPFFSFFFGEHLRLCPWSLASSIPVLGLESVCPRKSCPWPWPRKFFVSLASSLVSSTPPLVARGRGGYSPPIGLSTKMQNKKNTTFLALLRLFFALKWTKKWFKAFFETHMQGGSIIRLIRHITYN